MSPIVSARGVSKSYGKKKSLVGLDLEIGRGRIVGLIGPNGSGKTTALKAILGLTSFDGELSVLGLDPRKQRDELMNEVCFIADVAILPRWLKVSEAIDFVEGIHPKFDRARAESYLVATNIDQKMRVKAMSKGMMVQLHLALVMSIDAKLLVLDEPTLGLDLVNRKKFYQQLLEDYFDEDRTIIVATHQVDEIENILTDLAFLDAGELVLRSTMDAFAQRFIEVEVNQRQKEDALKLCPIDQREILGQSIMLFDGVPLEDLMPYGVCKAPSVSDVYVAMMKGEANGRN